MSLTSTITQKGQVTIPLLIREEFGLEPKIKVMFVKNHNKVYIKRAVSFLDLAGSVKSKKPFNIPAMTRIAKKHVSQNYAKSS